MRLRGEPPTGVTPREREVIALVRLGLANKQIAARLGSSHQTVRNQLISVFRKFGVHTRLELVVKAGHDATA